MKIEKITLSHLRADAHFELMVAALAQEDAVLKKIARGVLTAQIAEADTTTI